MKVSFFTVLLLNLFFAGSCATPPPTQSAVSAGPVPVAHPELMVFSDGAAPEAAARTLERLMDQLVKAHQWNRPVLTQTVFSRLKLPLPAECNHWGHVKIHHPESQDPKVDRPLGMVMEIHPMVKFSPDEVVGPEDEPAKKKKGSSGLGEMKDPPLPVHFCAVILVHESESKMKLGVVPLFSTGIAPSSGFLDLGISRVGLHWLFSLKSGYPVYEHQEERITGKRELYLFSPGFVARVEEQPELWGKPEGDREFRLLHVPVFGRLLLQATDTGETPEVVCAWVFPDGSLAPVSGEERELFREDPLLRDCR